MTASKKVCLDDSLPLVVEQLIEFLDENPEAKVFTSNDLEGFLNRMQAQLQRDYLELAGLTKGRKAITASRPTLYWRKGYDVKKANGEWVVKKDEKATKLNEASYLQRLAKEF